MKQVLIRGGQACVEETPPPVAGRGEALVRVSHSLISSGTESAAVSGGGAAGYLMKKARNPLNVEKVKRKIASVGVKQTLELVRGKLFEYQPAGYSCSGVIVELGGDVPGFRVGDRVACAGGGKANHAAYNAVPHQLMTPIPDGVEFDEAAFVALGAIAIQGFRQTQPSFGETFVVLGLGLIGQLMVQIVRAAGCRAIACDPVAPKRALASELGADAVCAPEDAVEMTAEWTGGHGADGVVVCAASASSEVTNQALELCRQKGRVSVVGAVGLSLQREPLYMKELDFRLSCSYGPGRYDAGYEEKGLDYPIGYVRWTEGRNMQEFLRMLAEGKVRARPLVSRVHPVEDAPKAYAEILDPAQGIVSALLTYGLETEAQAAAPETRRLAVMGGKASGDIGVAVIGAGGFASAFHLPSLAKIPGCRIAAIAARTGTRAKPLAERFGAGYCTTDYREALADPGVHAVVVATRHHLHAEIAGAAIAAGKHVFVEKPLAMTESDCESLCEAAASAGVLLTVGFNRRCAPLAVQLKAALGKRSGPAMVSYRCNAGSLPPDHWTLDPEEGGGRILGEGVHFFDFCCWLLDADPVSIAASRLDGDGRRVRGEDNLSVQLRFADGSLATVLYTCVGHLDLGKERVEAYRGGGGAALEDYRSLRFAGWPGKAARPGREDKGQYALMENFIGAIRGETALAVTGADGLRATRIALAALRAANGTGPV